MITVSMYDFSADDGRFASNALPSSKIVNDKSDAEKESRYSRNHERKEGLGEVEDQLSLS